MMAFSIDQLNYLKGQAEALRKVLESQVIHGYTPEMQVELIAIGLREACSMGYSIALDEVRSTPWEFTFQPVGVSKESIEQTANGLAVEGWEMLMSASGWVIWRRRKAVRELEAQSV